MVVTYWSPNKIGRADRRSTGQSDGSEWFVSDCCSRRVFPAAVAELVRPIDTMPQLRHLITIMSLLALLFGGCSKQSTPQSSVSPDAPVLKVAVFADGRLTVDGTTSTIQSLRESLRVLSEKHGVVWYYREAGQQEPPPISVEAMKSVIEARLPIRLSSRPDYSDSIGADGRPITK